MKLVIQRCQEASVSVDQKLVGKIEFGLVILVGFQVGDTEKEINSMVDKVLHLRIFDDENGIMNRSLLDIKGSILSISQFTLYGDTKKGRRPSYHLAMNREEAILLYEKWNCALSAFVPVETGVFGADMKVTLINDGPVTFVIESGETCA